MNVDDLQHRCDDESCGACFEDAVPLQKKVAVFLLAWWALAVWIPYALVNPERAARGDAELLRRIEDVQAIVSSPMARLVLLLITIGVAAVVVAVIKISLVAGLVIGWLAMTCAGAVWAQDVMFDD